MIWSAKTRFVVTGASGWLGRATLEELHHRLGDSFAARVHAYAGADRVVPLRNGVTVTAQALARLDDLPAGPPTVLLHYAFLTREKATAGLDAYTAANAAISATVERAVRRLRPEGMVLMSSGAVYLGDDPAANPYGVLKRHDEARFAACAPGRLVTCRLFNLSGPYMNKLDSYVLACLIGDALARRPLRLRATRPVWRSYVHVADLVRLALAAAATPGPPVCFDTAGDETVEVGALAERVRAALACDDLPIERQWDAGGAADRYVGDGTEMRRLAAALGVTFRGLDEQIADTAAYLASNISTGLPLGSAR